MKTTHDLREYAHTRAGWTRSGWVVEDERGERRGRLEWHDDQRPGYIISLMIHRDEGFDLNWYGSSTDNADRAATLASAMADAARFMDQPPRAALVSLRWLYADLEG